MSAIASDPVSIVAGSSTQPMIYKKDFVFRLEVNASFMLTFQSLNPVLPLVSVVSSVITLCSMIGLFIPVSKS